MECTEFQTKLLELLRVNAIINNELLKLYDPNKDKSDQIPPSS